MCAFPRKAGINDYQFSGILDGKLFGILEKYVGGKPVVIFCATRKGELLAVCRASGLTLKGTCIGVMGTAAKIAKAYRELLGSRKAALPWKVPGRSVAISFTFWSGPAEEESL